MEDLFQLIETGYGPQASDIIDECGVRYSKDGRKLISAPKDLEGCYEIKAGVEIICDHAFGECKKIEEIVFPKSVLAIGNHNFNFCDKIENFELPDSLLQIGDYAFEYCDNIRKLVMPDSVKYIGEESFEYSSSLEELKVSDSLMEINRYTFAYLFNLRKITLPKSLKKIGDYFLYHSKELEEIDIPDSVEEIGICFVDCPKLKYLKLPVHLKSIECNPLALGRKISFSKSIMPNSEYEQTCFEGHQDSNFRWFNGAIYTKDFTQLIACSPTVKELAIPGTVKKINRLAFDGCKFIDTVLMPYSLEDYSVYDMFGSRNDYQYNLCHDNVHKDYLYLDVLLPRGQMENYKKIQYKDIFGKPKQPKWNIIEKRLFPCSFLPEDKLNELFFVDDQGGVYSKDKKTLIRVPENVTGFYHINPETEIIGENAFFQCKDIVGIEFPRSLKEIRSNAFLQCKSLASIDLPMSVVSVGAGAFEECTSLKNVVVNNPELEVPENAFVGCKLLKNKIMKKE